MLFTYITRIGLAAITFGIGSATAMSSTQPTSSSALASASALSAVASPAEQITVIIPQKAEMLASDTTTLTTLSCKPLATWTADNLIQWLNGDAQGWNPERPLLSWFELDLIQEQIRYIFNRHRYWYQNNDTFTAFLKASNFLDFLSLNNHDDVAVSNELFAYLQKYSRQALSQPTPSSDENPKDCKTSAITHVPNDEPSLDDDREVTEIMRRKPTPKVITLEQMLEIQQRALQETHDCTTWLAWRPRTVQQPNPRAQLPQHMRKGPFKSRTFRRL